MEHLSPHGLLFVGLQLVVVFVLALLIVRHHKPQTELEERKPHVFPVVLLVLFVAWYIALRVQPGRRGADPFGYMLGVFDGVSLAGFLGLIVVHVLLTRRPLASARGKTL